MQNLTKKENVIKEDDKEDEKTQDDEDDMDDFDDPDDPADPDYQGDPDDPNECKSCRHHEVEIFELRSYRAIREKKEEEAIETATNYISHEHEIGLLSTIIHQLPFETMMHRKNYYVNYKNPHEKSNKNYITDMFNYLGYALFIIIGNDKEYHDWCKNGRRQFLDDPIARDVYYLLKYLKDSKLPDNPYVSHLFDCRNAIAHWTDERDHFRSFNTLDMNSLERENSSLVPEEEEKNQQSKKTIIISRRIFNAC